MVSVLFNSITLACLVGLNFQSQIPLMGLVMMIGISFVFGSVSALVNILFRGENLTRVLFWERSSLFMGINQFLLILHWIIHLEPYSTKGAWGMLLAFAIVTLIFVLTFSGKTSGETAKEINKDNFT